MNKRITILSVKDTDKRPKGDIKLWSRSGKTFLLQSRNNGEILGRFFRKDLAENPYLLKKF